MNRPEVKNGLTEKVFSRIVAEKYGDSVTGDMHEIFLEIAEQNGTLRAHWWWFLQIMTSMPRLINESFYRSTAMFANYLKVAMRNIKRQKIYSAINVLGLSIGVACTILIYLFVEDEVTYDQFHENLDNIFLITSQYGNWGIAQSPGPLGNALKEEFPEVLDFLRFDDGEFTIRKDGNLFKENILYADNNFFEVFSFDLQHGDEATALVRPNSLILSGSAAEKYFGKENPINEGLSIKIGRNYVDFVVTGVLRTIPNNSSIKFDFLVPFENVNHRLPEGYVNEWRSYAFSTLITVASPQKVSDLEAKIAPFIEKNLTALAQSQGQKIDNYKFYFNPLKDHHFSDYPSARGLAGSSNPMHSYILSGIAFLILFIASVNFMNLSIGRSSTRFKEVGVRKVFGARKKQLIKQFWFESVLLSLFAMIAGVLLAFVSLSTFNTLADKQLFFADFINAYTLFGMLILGVCAGIVSGSYPALVLSSLKTVEIFKGKLKVGGKNLLSNSLVIVQFSLSTFLIVSTLIMFQQQSFLKHKDLGFNPEGVVAIRAKLDRKDDGNRLVEYFRNELVGQKNISHVFGTGFPPFAGSSYDVFKDSKGKSIFASVNKIDYEFLSTMEIELLEGRDFDPDQPSDRVQSIIVNESFARELAVENPIGYKLPYTDGGIKEPRIIGVAKDFHYYRLQSKIMPGILHIDAASPVYYILVKITNGNISEAVDFIKTKWEEIKPGELFEYTSLEEDVESTLKSEEKWSSIITYASFFSIIIACLGLFGLTNISVAKRSKEIGIRKVLGATPAGILKLINRDFALQVLLANIIGWPVAHFAMTKWLQSFAYKTDVALSIYIYASIIVLAISIVTVSTQSLRSAVRNPSDSIRYE